MVVLDTHISPTSCEVRLAFPRDGENRHGESGLCQGVLGMAMGWQWDMAAT